jgi:hypothetical protein
MDLGEVVEIYFAHHPFFSVVPHGKNDLISKIACSRQNQNRRIKLLSLKYWSKIS